MLCGAPTGTDNKQDSNGWTSLHLTARNGNFNFVQLCLEAGADSSLQTIDGRTALDIATNVLDQGHPMFGLLSGDRVSGDHVELEPEGDDLEDVSKAAIRDAVGSGNVDLLKSSTNRMRMAGPYFT